MITTLLLWPRSLSGAKLWSETEAVRLSWAKHRAPALYFKGIKHSETPLEFWHSLWHHRFTLEIHAITSAREIVIFVDLRRIVSGSFTGMSFFGSFLGHFWSFLDIFGGFCHFWSFWTARGGFRESLSFSEVIFGHFGLPGVVFVIFGGFGGFGESLSFSEVILDCQGWFLVIFGGFGLPGVVFVDGCR